MIDLHIHLTDAEYRALAHYATRDQITAHVLVERLVRHALTATQVNDAARRRQDTVDVLDAAGRAAERSSGRKAVLTAEHHEQIVFLHAQGLSDSRIAQRMNVSGQTIARARKHLGLPPNFGANKQTNYEQENAA